MKLKIIIQPIHLPQCDVLYDKAQYRRHCFTASESLFWTCKRITPLPTCTRVEVHIQCQPVGYDGSDICAFQVGEFKIARNRLSNSLPAPGSDGRTMWKEFLSVYIPRVNEHILEAQESSPTPQFKSITQLSLQSNSHIHT